MTRDCSCTTCAWASWNYGIKGRAYCDRFAKLVPIQSDCDLHHAYALKMAEARNA